jgi:hypothetical protein
MHRSAITTQVVAALVVRCVLVMSFSSGGTIYLSTQQERGSPDVAAEVPCR